ncbi:monovalent cation/H+ antiporter subunit D family protein [Parvularcula sp. ZS-1/3]|uniref:Monovalent cation/H+ antiporter subunit D family protein n=1 Tax=Parvularcula mediterranea TaxID=2732508 RepID=A0A7Y3RM45_9PROT|nr:proton-conducting transporter membrane subunit [Parvularcula mediterranea]NNU16619.1 monovalent cation/H+ antiporter subunit D family protein [Parvularcula mediterranea]
MEALFSAVSLETAIAGSMIAPLVGLVFVAFLDRSPNLRESASIASGLVTLFFTLTIFTAVGTGARPELAIIEMLPGLEIKFKVEPLGALFGLIASGLWVVNTVYSIGYMRGHDAKGQTRFYMAFCVAISAALGIAYAGNLLTFFLFYEVLTISTFPLVTHERNEAARAGGRVYLGILMGTSIGLLLPGVIWVYGMTGTTDFVLGGILGDVFTNMPLVFGIMLALFAWGTAKAALMPFHPWLPNAMVAPTPVSAFLHAVAVVKAGVFGVLKVTVYTFGAANVAESVAADVILYVAAASILIASFIAMTQDNLKARLAYSTVSQLSYITLGAMLATKMGILGGGTQIAAHALGKMTLFMCAGAIATATHKKYISEMRGLGRVMPYTFIAYIIGACSIIGLPPLAGTWPKFFLMLSSVETGDLVLIAILILSSLLNIVYLLPPAVRAFMDPVPRDQVSEVNEAPLLSVVPAWLTAIGCLILFIYMGDLVRYLEPLVEGL